MNLLLTPDSSQLCIWAVISVAVGAMAGLVTAIFSRHGKDCTKAPSTAGADADDLKEIESSKSRSAVLVAFVMAVLMFLVCCVGAALARRGFI